VAPLWADYDFRNDIPTSKVYYNTYERRDGLSFLDQEILDQFNVKLGSSGLAGSGNFQPAWMAVITWNDAVPFPHYDYSNQVTLNTDKT